MVKPTELAYEGVLYETSLLFRSQDFHTRVLVKFHAAPEEPDNPYRMSFFNLAFGDRGGDKSVELKHSTSGFIWIEGGHVVSHYTGENHIFTIRNGALKDVFSVKLLPPRHDEL